MPWARKNLTVDIYFQRFLNIIPPSWLFFITLGTSLCLRICTENNEKVKFHYATLRGGGVLAHIDVSLPLSWWLPFIPLAAHVYATTHIIRNFNIFWTTPTYIFTSMLTTSSKIPCTFYYVKFTFRGKKKKLIKYS